MGTVRQRLRYGVHLVDDCVPTIPVSLAGHGCKHELCRSSHGICLASGHGLVVLESSKALARPQYHDYRLRARSFMSWN